MVLWWPVFWRHFGYDAQLAAQAPDTINGIKLSVSLFASIPFLLGVAIVCLYEINKHKESQIEQELNERRAAAGLAQAE